MPTTLSPLRYPGGKRNFIRMLERFWNVTTYWVKHTLSLLLVALDWQ